jgi:hypothetical protein
MATAALRKAMARKAKAQLESDTRHLARQLEGSTARLLLAIAELVQAEADALTTEYAEMLVPGKLRRASALAKIHNRMVTCVKEMREIATQVP